MALNLEVPITDIGTISPISPMRMDCWKNTKGIGSPIGSESSGVSSLDSEEIKIAPIQKNPETIDRELRIIYNGRNILDLYNNVRTDSTCWDFRYSHLPEKNNISMFWANRSLYNRLGPNGLNPMYTISNCECCDFQLTSDCSNNYLSETSLVMSSTTSSPSIFTTASSNASEYRSVKTSLSNTPNKPIMYISPVLNNQQNRLDFNNIPLNNQNSSKLSDSFSNDRLNFSNSNDCLSNYSKINNGISNTNLTIDLSQLASNIVPINVSQSTSCTPPLINYGNSVRTNYDFNDISKSSDSIIPPNIFNNNSINLPSSNINLSANNSFHDINAFPNNAPPNPDHTTNSLGSRYHTPSSNNLFSFFNSNNTNNAINHAFSANVENNINSFNQVNNRNNFTNNSLTLNSQNYGRMYKYF